jgi:pimeloyl-ACP methyl ester carboxylesterase
MTTYVLIPGACHGAWCFDDLAALSVERHAEDLVLVGHSYVGMVISGVADRVPERVDALVYLDALVPRDGESWDLVNDEERQWYVGVDDTGYGVPPMPFFDDRATAHPLASLLQRITLTGELSRIRRRDFAYALQWPGDSPLRPSYERVRDDPSWVTHELNGAHNLMRDNPEDLLRILLDVGTR